MPVGAISAHGAATAPTGWLLCDGTSYLRTDYADLFTAIGTSFGTADGTHFNVPDLRQRYPLGVALSGTGSTFAGTGGAIDHQHTAPSHTHGVTEATAHTGHVVTQASAHTTVTHDESVATHTLTHDAALSNHSVSTEAGAHGTHTTAGAHTHDTHGTTAKGAGSTSHLTNASTHTSVGGHTHTAHSSHSGSSIDAHSITGSHSLAHTVTQPSDHTSPSHSGATVTGAHTHTGSTISTDAGPDMSASNPLSRVLVYIIRSAV